jgi:hypothetical protein
METGNLAQRITLNRLEIAKMLRSTADLAELVIHATDGNMGSLADIYFDDIHWHVRYFVVDTGRWLPGRLVLISPASVASADATGRQLNVTLTKLQVEQSPGIETHETVSRQHELHMSKYYGWPVYWPAEGALAPDSDQPQPGDANLRGAAEVRGYHVHAQDGDLGHVADFLIDETTWDVRYLVVDTGKWLPGKKVLVDPRAADRIDWAKSTVHVHLTKDQIKNLPTYDPSGAREALDKAHIETFQHWPTYWY